MDPPWIDPDALAKHIFYNWGKNLDTFSSVLCSLLPEFEYVKSGSNAARGATAVHIKVAQDGSTPDLRKLHPKHLRIDGPGDYSNSKVSANLLEFILGRATAGLVSLEICWVTLEAAQWEALCGSIGTLRALSLAYVGGMNVAVLARSLARPGCLIESLEIKSCHIGTVGIEELSKALVGGCSKIWHLEIYDNSQAIFKSLAAVLQSQGCKLDVLVLYSFDFTIGDGFFHALSTPSCRALKLLVTDNSDTLRSGTRVKWLLLYGSENTRFETGSLAGVQHLGLGAWGLKYHRSLSQELGSADCALQSLVVRSADIEPLAVLETLGANYSSRITVLDFDSIRLPQHLEERRKHILNRNALFLASECQGTVKASVAKLFICGDGGAGKTTIATNLTRSIQVPACFQRHEATQGISLKTLSYKSNRLVVCDIAGQAEYHAFHHYFMRGSDRDLFLIVCKVATPEDMSRHLTYWLRFITSHCSSNPARKPKVLVALNIFGGGGVSKTCSEAAMDTMKQFHDSLDIEANGFQVIATKVRSLRPLRSALGKALKQVLGGLPLIPPLCEKLEMSSKVLTCCLPRKPRVVEISDLLDIVQIDVPGEKVEIEDKKMAALKFALTCMHDMGKAVYFGADGKQEDVLSSRVILDVQWFVQELVGKFIKVNRGNTGNSIYSMNKDELEAVITTMCDIQHFDFVKKALQELGVLLCHEEEIIVPALLQNEVPNWNPHKHNIVYCHWGRRLQCKNKKCTLLPSGIFTMLQVKVKTELCTNPIDTANGTTNSMAVSTNSSFRVGRGWVYFQRSKVQVLVRIGGDTDRWEDRHWVDILVKAEQQAGHQAGKMMIAVKERVQAICSDLPKLELEELIINPVHVRQRMCQAGQGRRGGASDPSIVVPLSSTKKWFKKVLAKQTEEVEHTWDQDQSNYAEELLMMDELEELAAEWRKQVDAAFEECAAIEGCALPQLTRSKTLQPKLSPENEALQKYIAIEFEGVNKRLDKVDATLEEVKAIVRDIQLSMEKYGDKLLTMYSRTLNMLETQYPRIPYFCAGNKLFKYSLVGTKVELRYMCEAEVAHQVARCDGLTLQLPYDWFKQYSHLLVPALKYIFLAARVGGKVAASFMHVGDVFDAPIDFSEKELKDVLDSVLGTDLARNQRQATEQELEDLFSKVEDQAIKERVTTESFMRKTFGLRRVWKGDRHAWVCEYHLNC